MREKEDGFYISRISPEEFDWEHRYHEDGIWEYGEEIENLDPGDLREIKEILSENSIDFQSLSESNQLSRTPALD